MCITSQHQCAFEEPTYINGDGSRHRGHGVELQVVAGGVTLLVVVLQEGLAVVDLLKEGFARSHLQPRVPCVFVLTFAIHGSAVLNMIEATNFGDMQRTSSCILITAKLEDTQKQQSRTLSIPGK